MNTERKLEAPGAATTEAAYIDRVLDANELDSPLWTLASPVHITRYWSGDEAPAGRYLEARLLWSQSALCVRFVCRQTEPLIVSSEAQVERKTLGLWDRDVCEIFVVPDRQHPEHYLEFEASPAGEWLDLAIHKTRDGRDTDWDFCSGMAAGARINDDSVTIAIIIPWGAFSKRPNEGDRWRMNLTRCVGAGESRGYLAWRPTHTERPDFHAPEAFGDVIFKG